VREVLHRAGFKDLEFEERGINRRIIQQRAKAIDEVGLLKVMGADVDADRT
jgi:hypothetical protein